MGGHTFIKLGKYRVMDEAQFVNSLQKLIKTIITQVLAGPQLMIQMPKKFKPLDSTMICPAFYKKTNIHFSVMVLHPSD